MFVRSNRRLDVALSLLFVFALGACGNLGGCGACGSTQPLPGGRLPTDQTVESGAQIRVTPQGFSKLTSIVPGVLNSSLANGFCLGRGQFGDPSACTFPEVNTGAEWCYTNANGCSPGCKATVGLNPNGLAVSVTGANTLNVALSANLSMPFTLRGRLACISLGSCTITATSNNLEGDFDIRLGVRPDNGELALELDRINTFQLNMDFNGCGILSDIGGLLTAIVDSFVGQFIIDLLTPAINNLVQGFLPDPLGIAGMLDVGDLLAGISPGTSGFLEARVVPGGHATLSGGGMNLGVITGLNADEDPTTRTAALDSEPNLCVPPLPAPSFGAAPHNLPTINRSALGGSTFILQPAGLFAGASDPANVDLALGISETTLDLAGHHLVTSGGMCLGVGTPLISQLNVGTIGILVPSLAELQSDAGNDPLLLVTRPQTAIDFTIGDNTTASPALTIHLKNLEVDFYAFLFERYTRAFTLDLTANIGINLDFETQGTTTVIKPSLVGLSSSQVTVKVINSEFVKETPAELEAVLPSVFDLVTPLLGTLPDIPVPTFAGFSLTPLDIQKIVTSQDDFLALTAQLGAGPMMRLLADRDPFASEAVAMLDGHRPIVQTREPGAARLIDVDTPPPAVIRDALAGKSGALPSVTFEVDRVDAHGRELEWSWNLDGGWWRPYVPGGPLVISDRALAWQGRFEIGLKSRVKGDFRTTSDVHREKVVIDSVGPQIFADRASWDDGDLTVPVWDVVFGKDVEVAFGTPGADAPSTAWMPAREASLSRQQAMTLAEAHAGELQVFARDELGNQTVARIAPFHGQAGEGGCTCQTSGRPGAGSLLLVGLVGVGLLRRRRPRWTARISRLAASRAARTVVTFVGIVALSSLVPACSCGDKAGQSCETADDCGPGFCPPGQLPFCIDNTCLCSDDIPPGRIGLYSDVAVGGGLTWVSAYASTFGDLVVAQAQGGRIPTESWEWVDGVPDGPVVVPGSQVRGGIDDKGEDVGMYTSIAVAADGTPMVAYFDRSNASLKFAAKVDGAWQIHVVDQGTTQFDPELGGSLAGMYASLTLRADDGRPGIAYLAHVADAMGERAEVRYVAAQTALPASAGDWQKWTVDSAPIPANPDEVYPLPGGLGLFVDSARNPQNQAPVVVYYDRSNGDLKLSRFNPASGQFGAPVVLDGSNGDAGWSPSVTVDAAGVAHVAYVGATGDDLMYVTDAAGAAKETIDDGYRIVGTTVDGLPKPEFHFVGDDASIVLPTGGGQPIVTYQDATTHELLLAQRQMNGTWTRSSVAGATDPWPGAYGFYASAVVNLTDLVMSTWVIHQPLDDNWVEVLSRPTVVQ